jgi:hypothetical protein
MDPNNIHLHTDLWSNYLIRRHIEMAMKKKRPMHKQTIPQIYIDRPSRRGKIYIEAPHTKLLQGIAKQNS